MKKKNGEKKSLKVQLISGTVYAALACVVVAVTINATVGMISDKVKIPNVDEISEFQNTDIPSLPEIKPLNIPELDSANKVSEESSSVSEISDGIDALITESSNGTSQNISEISISDAETETDFDTKDIYGIPINADLGIDRFIKPCNGFVSKSHSVEIPVYSVTLSDYRTHTGIDVVEAIGTEIVCISGGIITDIYNDDLYGITVETKNRDGYTVKYSNLAPSLATGVEKNAIIKTASPIGTIGETAICEASESSHIHIEIYDAQGTAVNPEDLISF